MKRKVNVKLRCQL